MTEGGRLEIPARERLPGPDSAVGALPWLLEAGHWQCWPTITDTLPTVQAARRPARTPCLLLTSMALYTNCLTCRRGASWTRM